MCPKSKRDSMIPRKYKIGEEVIGLRGGSRIEIPDGRKRSFQTIRKNDENYLFNKIKRI